MRVIGNRLPHRREVIAVLGVTVFLCHSWTLLGFFNKLPSYLLYFTPSEIFGVFAYMMAFALLESLGFTSLLVLLSFILPSSWLKDGFAYKGFIIVVIATAASILFQKYLPNDYPSALMLAVSAIVPLFLIVVLIGVSASTPSLQSLFRDIEDRFSIMLYIFVPIGLLSTAVVIARNLS